MTSEEVRISIPADQRFVPLARVAAAILATDLGFSIDEIDDLRIGAHELIATLVEWSNDGKRPSGGRVELTYIISERGVELHGVVDAARNPAAIDEITEHVLAAVTDRFELAEDRGSLVKRPGH